ncbi:hypothetical protein K1719_003394 [Acacia pycnantha]|nr:hypothetical protein K1719_003394 [Acacia pycnantha]
MRFNNLVILFLRPSQSWFARILRLKFSSPNRIWSFLMPMLRYLTWKDTLPHPTRVKNKTLAPVKLQRSRFFVRLESGRRLMRSTVLRKRSLITLNLAVQFKIRQLDLVAARKILGNAIVIAPKDKIFNKYIVIDGFEEYIDYIFPEEAYTTNLKLLEAAYQWKKKQKLSSGDVKVGIG